MMRMDMPSNTMKRCRNFYEGHTSYNSGNVNALSKTAYLKEEARCLVLVLFVSLEFRMDEDDTSSLSVKNLRLQIS